MSIRTKSKEVFGMRLLFAVALISIAGCGPGTDANSSFTYTPISNVPQAVNDLGKLICQEQRNVVTPGGDQWNPGFSSADQASFESSDRLTTIVNAVKSSQTFAAGVAGIRTLTASDKMRVFTSYQTPLYLTWAMNGHIGADGTTEAGYAVENEIATALTNAVKESVLTLLSDDFSGAIVSANNWHIPTWVSSSDGTFIGQTQFRCSQNAQLPVASNGNALITVDTYNPTGSSFYGTDLISNQSFSLGQGITVTVRAKIAASDPPGTVGGIFLYAPPVAGNTTLHDEIDFEILSNDLKHIHTNIYGNESLGVGHPESYAYASGSATDYHMYQIQWLPDRVSWSVDGTLIRTVTTQSSRPLGPMYVHLNMWVPGSEFADAYDPSLHWSNSSSSDQTLLMYVDSVTVAAVSN